MKVELELVLTIEDEPDGSKTVQLYSPEHKRYWARWVSPTEMRFLFDPKGCIVDRAALAMRAMLDEILK